MVDLKLSAMKHLGRLHNHLWFARAMTFGVRALVLHEGRVFLVRHTYVPGWYLPGGAVDRGESAEAAAVRELREEGGIVCTERPQLFGLYRNGRRDHVAFYIVRQFTLEPPSPTFAREIAECGFFTTDALPPDTTPATRARIAELATGNPPAETW